MPAPRPLPPPAPDGASVVSEAKKFLGDKYVYGAEGPNTFDCSGLVQYVLSQFHVSVPRTSEEQYHFTDRITEKDLQAGDLVFSEMGSNGPGHVGIYDGNGGVVEAPHTGDVVKVLPLSEFSAVAYGRIPGVAYTGTGGGVVGGIVNTITGAVSNLINFPTQIVDYAAKATEDSTKALGWFSAFFQPGTYVRLGAGLLGTIFLVAGLYTLFLVESE